MKTNLAIFSVLFLLVLSGCSNPDISIERAVEQTIAARTADTNAEEGTVSTSVDTGTDTNIAVPSATAMPTAEPIILTSDLTIEYAAYLFTSRSLTALQREQYSNQFAGHEVTWRGIIYEVNADASVTVRAEEDLIFVEVHGIPASEAVNFQRGDILEFRGELQGASENGHIQVVNSDVIVAGPPTPVPTPLPPHTCDAAGVQSRPRFGGYGYDVVRTFTLKEDETATFSLENFNNDAAVVIFSLEAGQQFHVNLTPLESGNFYLTDPGGTEVFQDNFSWMTRYDRSIEGTALCTGPYYLYISLLSNSISVSFDIQ